MRTFLFCLFAFGLGSWNARAETTAGASTRLEFGLLQQQFEGWGFTPAPSDWDGMVMARDPAIAARVFQASGASVARFLIGKSHDPLFDEATGALQNEAFDLYVARYIRALVDRGMAAYIVSFASPPKWMKKYYSDSAHVYLDPNTLRPEYVEDYARFVASAIGRLRDLRLPLPRGVSIQEQPDCPPPPFGCPPALPQGCQYEPGLYHQALAAVRGHLDAAGLQAVRLLGPETQRPDSLHRFHDPQLADTFVFSTIASPLPVLDWEPGRHGKLWVRGLAPTKANDAASIAVTLVRQLTHDMALTGANYWLWPYGFAQDDTGEALRFGNAERDTSLFPVLTELWRLLPRQGRVCRVVARRPDGGEQLVGFAIQSETEMGLVALNDTGASMQVALPEYLDEPSSIHRFVEGRWQGHPIDLAAMTIELRPGIPLIARFGCQKPNAIAVSANLPSPCR